MLLRAFILWIGVMDEGIESSAIFNFRVPSDVNEEVNKSLDVLDRVLNEFHNEGGRQTHPRRQNIYRNESLKRTR